MRIGRVFGVSILTAMLGGCGLAARVDARNDYQKSTADYKACLAANPATPTNCEGLRLAMEADERRFNSIAASQSDASITVMNRR
jgi:hypothetical protein